tara:strand:- start:350 stop:586 length:237 start_codon:yes stop_codon:yes gene_type:complete
MVVLLPHGITLSASFDRRRISKMFIIIYSIINYILTWKLETEAYLNYRRVKNIIIKVAVIPNPEFHIGMLNKRILEGR